MIRGLQLSATAHGLTGWRAVAIGSFVLGTVIVMVCMPARPGYFGDVRYAILALGQAIVGGLAISVILSKSPWLTLGSRRRAEPNVGLYLALSILLLWPLIPGWFFESVGRLATLGVGILGLGGMSRAFLGDRWAGLLPLIYMTSSVQAGILPYGFPMFLVLSPKGMLAAWIAWALGALAVVFHRRILAVRSKMWAVVTGSRHRRTRCRQPHPL